MQMRFFRDDPRTTTVHWYFVGLAPFVPYVNRFMSSIWDSDDAAWPTLGEVPYSQTAWLDGKPPKGLPFSQRRRPCGTPSQWRNGFALPPTIPVARDDNGECACCRLNAVPDEFPFDPQFWVDAEDVPGPEYASVGTWEDRGEGHDDGHQDDAEEWPSKRFDAPHLPIAVRFGQGESLPLLKPIESDTWTVWCVVSPEPGKIGAFLFGENASIGFGFNHPGHGAEVFLNTNGGGGHPFLGLGDSLTPLTRPLILQAQYDGTTLVFNSWGGIRQSSSVTTELDPANWNLLGNPREGSFVGYVDVSEVMIWDHSLTDSENEEILHRLEERYLQSRFFIITEGGDLLTTESGDFLITE